MGVSVDQAGHHDLAGRVDDGRSIAMTGREFGRGADGDDAVADDRDSAILDHAAGLVHRHDDAVLDQDIGHGAGSGLRLMGGL